jgi:glycerophosphoryl diester phosphodiesterase
MRSPLIIGHRGFAARYSGNSLAGVTAAIAIGADGVEVDVRLCANGSWVCHHDRLLAGRPVREWDVRSLRRDGVPTLAEVAAVVPTDRQLFVEIKPLPERDLAERLEALATLVRPRFASTRIISSSRAVLAVTANVLAGIARSLVFDKIPRSLPEGVELSPHHTLVEALLTSDRRLHPWTVNRPRRMRELAGLGVASITTNDPRLALEVLRG